MSQDTKTAPLAAGAAGTATAQHGRGGWLEAGLFTLALSVLNVSYTFGQQQGVHPIALLFWAMPVAAVSLLAVGGLGRDWLQVMAYPLSIVVGGGIILMDAVYYLLLGYVTPTDGSLLVRLGVPAAMLLGYLFSGRRPTRLAVLGALIMVAVILWYVPQMPTSTPWTGLAFGTACGFIMSTRAFASEHHPWNRRAATIKEKMRITGLMLLLASSIGVCLVLAVLFGAEQGIFRSPGFMPSFGQLVYLPGILLGVFVGAIVLTAMQYVAFSAVLKLGTVRFVGLGTLIPCATLVLQEILVRAAVLAPIVVEWRILPAMAGVIAGAVLIVAGARAR